MRLRAGRAKDEHKKQTHKSKLQCVRVLLRIVQCFSARVCVRLCRAIHKRVWCNHLFSFSSHTLCSLEFGALGARTRIWIFHFNSNNNNRKKRFSHFVLIIIIFAAVAFLQFIYSYLHNNNFIYIYIMCVCVCVCGSYFFSSHFLRIHFFTLYLFCTLIRSFYAESSSSCYSSFCTRRCFHLNIGSFQIKY